MLFSCILNVYLMWEHLKTQFSFTWQEHSRFSQCVIQPARGKAAGNCEIHSDCLEIPPTPLVLWEGTGINSEVTTHGVSPSLELFDADRHVQVALRILLDHVPHVVRIPRLLRDRDGIHENHCHHRRLFFSSLGP